MSTIARYIAFQVPSWLLVTGLAVALEAWFELPRPWLAAAVALYVAKDFALYPWVREAYAHSEPDPTVVLVGALAVVEVALEPQGWVRLGAEPWRAECVGEAPAHIPIGETVVVRAVRGHTLLVDPAPVSAPGV